MLCLVHGYALSGSGSNLWTRLVVEALCRSGETVHLVCQDRRPEGYDFVAEAYEYDPQGRPTLLLNRPTPYEGRCILHRTQLDVLPVYVQPPSGVEWMQPIPEMSDEAIETYLDRNAATLTRVIRDRGVTAVHVNHVVLMSAAVQRACGAAGIPYAVMPHGSAIEYVVRRDPRMHRMAEEALTSAKRIFVLSEEMRGRVLDVFPGVPDAAGKMRRTSVGVDVEAFRMVSREERGAAQEGVRQAVQGAERGKTADQTNRLFHRLEQGDPDLEEMQALVTETGDYLKQRPDADLERKLDALNPERNDVVLFVGKLIGFKGVPSVVAAFPMVLRERPNTRLVIVGRGPLREALEAMVWALAHGRRGLVDRLARWGSLLEEGPPAPFDRVTRFFESLEARGELDAYFETAERLLKPDHVVFTGHLEHDALSRLYPCCDVAVFPSVVAEAGPLVLLEAMASGCFPMGTYFAGMGANLDNAGRALPEEQARLMRLRPEPEHTVRDIAHHIPAALALDGSYREALREVTVRNYDWRTISRNLARELRDMGAAAP